jgi:hypothetical protein
MNLTLEESDRIMISIHWPILLKRASSRAIPGSFYLEIVQIDVIDKDPPRIVEIHIESKWLSVDRSKTVSKLTTILENPETSASTGTD